MRTVLFYNPIIRMTICPPNYYHKKGDKKIKTIINGKLYNTKTSIPIFCIRSDEGGRVTLYQKRDGEYFYYKEGLKVVAGHIRLDDRTKTKKEICPVNAIGVMALLNNCHSSYKQYGCLHEPLDNLKLHKRCLIPALSLQKERNK